MKPSSVNQAHSCQCTGQFRSVQLLPRICTWAFFFKNVFFNCAMPHGYNIQNLYYACLSVLLISIIVQIALLPTLSALHVSQGDKESME